MSDWFPYATPLIAAVIASPLSLLLGAVLERKRAKIDSAKAQAETRLIAAQEQKIATDNQLAIQGLVEAVKKAKEASEDALKLAECSRAELEAIKGEVTHNHGSSLKDAVGRIATPVGVVQAKLSGQGELLKVMGHQIGETADFLNGMNQHLLEEIEDRQAASHQLSTRIERLEVRLPA